MEKIRRNRKGVIFGMVAFSLLYLPLAVAFSLQFALLVQPWYALLAQLLVGLLVPTIVSGFLAFSIWRGSKILIVLASVTMLLAFVATLRFALMIAFPQV